MQQVPVETTEDLVKIRKMQRWSQEDMAREMGLPLRTYQDIETGRSKLRQIHKNVAEWVSRLPAKPPRHCICSACNGDLRAR